MDRQPDLAWHFIFSDPCTQILSPRSACCPPAPPPPVRPPRLSLRPSQDPAYPQTPRFTSCPTSQVVHLSEQPNCHHATLAVVTWAAPTATSNALSISSNAAPGWLFSEGVTTVVYDATPADQQYVYPHGYCAFTITVGGSSIGRVLRTNCGAAAL